MAQAAPPANDNFAAAQLITGATASISGTLAEATKEAGEPNHDGHTGGRSVWYRWVAPGDSVVEVNLTGTYDHVLGVYTGNTVDGLTRVGSSHGGKIRFRAVAGAVYNFAVDYCISTAQAFTLNLTSSPRPANDDFAFSQSLSGADASATASTFAATREAGEPSHGYYGDKSLWYSWTAPSTGAATIDTAGSNFNTLLGVYTGDALGGLNKVALSDDVSYSVRTSRIVFHAVAGTTYRIAVDGYDGQWGNVALALRLRDGPENDAFSTAVELSSDTKLTATGRNDGASAEIGEPSHYSYNPATSSVWYRWTAPRDGSLTIKASSAFFSPVLAGYRGSQVSDLTRVPNQAQPCNCGPDQIRLRVDAGVTYWIAVDSRYAGTGGDFALSLDLIDRPPNDDFADAELLAGVSVDVNGTNLGATQEIGEPVHEQNYYDPSVWYSWTAPSTGGVTIDTTASTFNTVTSVYTGDAVNALTRVTSTANTTGVNRSKRSFRAVAGQTYRIVVDGAGAAQGDIKLSLRFRPVPANDMFAAAEPLVAGVATPGDNVGATGEPGEPSPGGTAGATIWYSWTAPSTGPFKLALNKKDFAPAGVNVYTGDTLNGLTRLTTNNWRYRGDQGTTYWIAVDGGTAPARGTFEIQLDQLQAPPNDDFANATVLTGTSDLESGTNVNATREQGEPSHVSSGSTSVWYRWTAPQSGPMTLDLTGSGYDNYAAVYTGSSLTSLTKVGSGYSKVKFNATEGTTYQIAIDGYYGYTGNVRVSLFQGIVPPNDLFANATELTGESDSESSSTSEATRETGEPAHAYSGSASVWYRWTAPRTGAAVVDITGSFYDAKAAVYTGTELANLKSVGGGKKIKFRAVQGTTYRIAVDGDYSSRGPVQLALSMPPGPANDDFDNAIELTGESDTESGSNLNATHEPGEPQHVYNGGGSVWYRWTAPRDGTVGITTSGSPYALSSTVYTGTALTGLTKQTSGSQITLNVTAGTTYRIAVDGDYYNAGNVTLTLAMKTPPANDNFANATEMTGTTDFESGSNAWSGSEPGEPSHNYNGGHSVWYRWTAPSTGSAKVNLTSSEYYMTATVYTGDSVGGLTRVATGKAITFRAVEGQTYRIAVDASYGYTASFELRTSLSTPPPNDDFANAQELSGDAAVVTGANSGGTMETGEPAPYYTGGSSVWYRWTAPRTGGATLDLEGSSFDTQMSVYTGDSVGGLTRVAQVRGKKVTFRAQEGTTYRIQVDGYYGATGSIRLALSLAPRPANDDFANEVALSGESTSTAGSNMGGTRETGEPAHFSSSSGETVWYRWTAARNGYLTVKIAATTSFTPVIAAYRGSTLTGLSKVSSTSGSMTFYVRKGDVLHIVVDGSTSSGMFTLTTSVAPAPDHDDFADAKALAGDHVSETSTVANASIQPGEPYHGTSAWNSVWYRWTAPATGQATLDLTGSGFPYVGAVYTGSALSNLSRVTWSSTSPTSFNVQAGETYWIAVASRTGAEGTVKLALDLVPQPANDDFANATVLAGESADDTGDNRAATAEAGEPAHDSAARKSVWWRWTAPSDGETTIDLSGSSFDTTLAVYTGADVASLTRVAGDDQAGAGDTSSVTFTATEGTTYSIAVDSFGSGTGSVAMALRHVVAPEPPAEEETQQQADPSAEEQQQSDPPAEEQQQSDPPAEQQQSDPPAEQQPQDPPAEEPQDEPADQGTDQPRGELPAASTSTHQDAAPSAGDSNTGGSVQPDQPNPAPVAPPSSEQLVLTTNFTQQNLKAVLSKGLTAMVACQSACAVEASATLDPATAKKLGLKAAGAPPFGSAAVQANGPTKVVLKLSKAAKRKLAKAKSLKLTVRFTARSGGRTATVTRKLTIKR